MGNTAQFEAVEGLRRWIVPNVNRRLRADLERAILAIGQMSEQQRRLAIAYANLRNDKPVPVRPRGRGSEVLGDVNVMAQAIAEAAADGPVLAFRFGPGGAARWLKASSAEAAKIDPERIVGTYDAGCDWRQIAEDLL